MANELTGDFDVVAQFAVPAANRVLATMHRVERFPHSVAIRVDDIEPDPSRPFNPSAIAAVDGFGDAIADQGRIRNLVPVSALNAASNWINFRLDPVVNLDNAGIRDVPIEPSDLQGRAQLQLFPPTINITDGSGTNVTVHIQMLARYFPDPGTTAIAEFIRGELRITAPVSQAASQVANVVEIDIKAANVVVNFIPQWTSKPLTAPDMMAINLLIKNALRTSFLPSNSRLPSNISHMQFKTLQGSGGAIAVLLDLDGGPSDRNSAGTVFLGSGDDFAFAVGSEFVLAAFQPTIDKILSTAVDPVSFKISTPVNTWNITYTVVLKSATVELRAGEILLTIKGRATTPSWPPNFDFTVKQPFSLEASGATADLVAGTVSLDTSSWIVDRFRGGAIAAISRVRDRALSESGARATIRRMLSADANLGGFLNSLVEPPRPIPGQQPLRFMLAYTGVDIRQSGIVLHGSLASSDWPAAHVEYEELASVDTGPLSGSVVDLEPEYSALKTWIPGGTAVRYEWKRQGQVQPGFSEPNKFVFKQPSPGLSMGVAAAAAPVSGYVPLCLTVHGTRLSSAGPVVVLPVSATTCGVRSFPILDAAFDGRFPLIALTEPDPRGMIRVTGHTNARKARAGTTTPNLIVHFGDGENATSLEALVTALGESKRGDASTAIIAVLSPNDLSNSRHVEGITYADDRDGAWKERFGNREVRRPSTIVIDPAGNVVAEFEGSIDNGKVVAELEKSLVAGRPVVPSMAPNTIRIGQLPPNFLFEYSPGHEVTLRKIIGRPVVVVFWRASSSQSIEVIHDVSHAGGASQPPIVLAVNDGDAPDAVKKAAADSRVTAIVVTDPSRSIARAYGIDTWPTAVSIDALGLVRAVRNGRTESDSDDSFVQQDASASRAR